MGPNSKDRLANVIDSQNAVLGSILDELQMQRATMARIAAKMSINLDDLSAKIAVEVEERTAADDQIGKQVQQHHGILGGLRLLSPGGE